jgi:hypothetical protein
MLEVIYPNAVTNVEVNSENPNFPGSNLLNDHPKSRWYANGVNEATLTVHVQANSSRLCIYSTNATAVEGTIKTGLGLTWLHFGDSSGASGNGIDWGASALSSGYVYEPDSSGMADSSLGAERDGGYGIIWEETQFGPGITISIDGTGRIWIEYPDFDRAHTVTLTLSCPEGEILYAGIIKGGIPMKFDFPTGVTQSMKDYSLVDELRDGSRWFKKRDLVRVFNLTIPMERRATDLNDFFDFMMDLHYNSGPGPIVYKLFNDVEGAEDGGDWVVFGYMSDVRGDHMAGFNRTMTTFKLTEVL